MYKPLLVCFLYVAGLVGVIEANYANNFGGMAGLYIGFAYFATLQLPLLISGFTSKPSGFYGYLRPIYITFPIAGVYSLAIVGLVNMPDAFHIVGAAAFIATIAIALYKVHILDNYVRIAE